ncbi:hypothetical protein BT96DRAFT_999507 [Gymnopus androsaceus JB14]|uniref:Uncharacterized protein n=1 Tax=Gymnopus androsaceus JB14 TaxID=1447944 RepID=A0A6A4H5K4_9AGAR|nr:hypothetical protein BT96DRAFT_999507 [Gymnopus androsaceus JB14]
MSETASEIDEITQKSTKSLTLTMIVDAATYIGTQAGGQLKGLVEVGPDGSYGMYTAKGHQNRIELVFVIQPRSYSAFKNGPDGNAVLPLYKDPAQCPPGITIEQLDNGQLVKKANWDGKEWKCLVWENNFDKNKECSWEWTVSGPPASEKSRDWVNSAFKAIESKFADAADQEMKIPFKNNKNGPADQMFVLARRSVVVDNAAPLDEGRASEYPDPFNLVQAIGPERDFKFNRVPEVLVVDHKKKEEFPMSFHDLHLLGNNVAVQVFVTPRAFKYQQKLSWDFRLICIKVLGKKEASFAVSPSKSVRKRTAVFLDDSDVDDPKPKKQNAGPLTSSSSA